jgi:NAD(P)-dependent dehydrogenase (short-subunit alcohol dehydrogenase family)
MTSASSPVLLVLGVGPGLGMSMAHRFGAEGYSVALVSRSDARHPAYLDSLAAAGVEAAAFTADASVPAALRDAVDSARNLFGRIDVGYYGPSSFGTLPGDIAELDAAGAEQALRSVVPAVDFASLLIPAMVARGSGGLIFAGGLSSVVPMPPLGGLAMTTAALRNYAITLHAALAPRGVYVGTVTVGGLIDGSDIHRAMAADDAPFSAITAGLLNPDDLAESAWQLYRDRAAAEVVVNALGATS